MAAAPRGPQHGITETLKANPALGSGAFAKKSASRNVREVPAESEQKFFDGQRRRRGVVRNRSERCSHCEDCMTREDHGKPSDRSATIPVSGDTA